MLRIAANRKNKKPNQHLRHSYLKYLRVASFPVDKSRSEVHAVRESSGSVIERGRHLPPLLERKGQQGDWLTGKHCTQTGSQTIVSTRLLQVQFAVNLHGLLSGRGREGRAMMSSRYLARLSERAMSSCRHKFETWSFLACALGHGETQEYY